jgi:hypothetical protein
MPVRANPDITGRTTVYLKNPLLERVHAHQRESVLAMLPETRAFTHDSFLSLHGCITARPGRFHCRCTYRALLGWLEETAAHDPSEVRRYFAQFSAALDLAFRTLEDVNRLDWHDTTVTDNVADLPRFISRAVNPTYLRLVEGVFTPLFHMVASFLRSDREARTDGLDAYHVAEELKSSEHADICVAYNHTIRNGIAHGCVVFTDSEVQYTDKRRLNTVSLAYTEVLRLLDDMLDVCNGAALAFRVYFLKNAGLGPAPQQVLFEELQAQTDAPWWRIDGWVESRYADGTQLLLFAQPNTQDWDMVALSTLQTVVLAEAFCPGYDRYFVSMRSANTKLGFAWYKGSVLSEARSRNLELQQLGSTPHEDFELAFLPRRRPSRWLRQWDTLRVGIALYFPLGLSESRRKMGLPMVEARKAEVHKTAWRTVLNGSVVLSGRGPIRMHEVRDSCRDMVSAALRLGRRSCTRCNMARYLPLGYARIHVFARDYRVRRLEGLGLARDLICTVQVIRVRQMRVIDIAGSLIEQHGRYRIAWNRAWLDATENPTKPEDATRLRQR